MSDEISDRSAGPGWHEDPNDPTVTRYWDGAAWTATRRWSGTEWIDEPGPSAAEVPQAAPPPSSPGGVGEVAQSAAGSFQAALRGPNRLLVIGGLVAAAVLLIVLVSGLFGGDDGGDGQFRSALRSECESDPEMSPDDCECVIDRMLDEFSTEELIEMGLDNPSGDFTDVPLADQARLVDAITPCVLGAG